MAYIGRSDDDFDWMLRDTKPSSVTFKEVKNMKYSINVSLSPEVHEGHMAHYWAVQAIDSDNNNYTVAHGYHRTVGGAANDAVAASKSL